MRIESGLKIGKLGGFRPILKEWQNLMTMFPEIWEKDDVPWWYTERTWVGILAAAAWKKGYWALEEYADKKIIHRKKRKQQRKPGRVDLLIGIDSREYLIEAKHVWINVGGGNGLMKVKNSLQGARVDVSRVRAYPGQKKLGMVCISPYVIQSKREQIDVMLSDFTKQLYEKVEGVTMAWIFPKGTRTYKAHGYFYPGGILVLRPLKL